MTVLVAVLVAGAVLALAGPPVRREVLRTSVAPHAPPPGTTPATTGALGGRSAPGAGPTGRVVSRAGRRGPWSGGTSARAPLGSASRGTAADLAGVLHAVASQLRAGVPPPDAWRSVLGVPGEDDGAPPAAALLATVAAGRAPGPAWRARTPRSVVLAHRSRVRAVLAGTRVAAETGAPLADVLADLAAAVTADAEQAADVAAALAGPRATARVLVLLPLLGLLVGAAIGARPWQVLTGGGVGSVLGVVGVTLMVGGSLWVRTLLRRAVAT
ncbi:type II secretion system F family protein [Cellulomonas sp. B6]|uniref:type II secretion system F family protein n=1 Tax=Cellulomonas sp. B6 TaxID=1295626 RepID=UPI00073C2CB3|nr:type II secretion system F family protein [Cellulomonas sp. B6]KSW16822.1 hypothetical protein ATM99_18425 [Cellulomonas sp. B6]